jgi:dnd system-associated protein 4
VSDRITYERPQIYERLVKEHDVFDSYVDLFVFAAAVGFRKDLKRPNAGGDKEMLWANVRYTEIYETIAASIAYQETGDPEILSDEQRQLEIMGEYAAGGIEFLADHFDGTGDPTVDLAEFILEEGTQVQADAESVIGDVI